MKSDDKLDKPDHLPPSTDIVFLGKPGQICGPFAQNIFLEMKSSGQIMEYSWIWDRSTRAWSPIEPSSLPETTPSALVNNRSSKKAGPEKKVRVVESYEVHDNRYLLVCHANFNFISGTMLHAEDDYCVMETIDHESSPVFGRSSRVTIDILDTEAKKATCVRGVVDSSERTATGWKYRLRWNEVPSLVTAA